MTTYKALVDLSVAKAGELFEADDEAVAPALAFGLAEPVEEPSHAREGFEPVEDASHASEALKPAPRRHATRKAS